MAHITHFNRYSKNTRLSAGRSVLALRQLHRLAQAMQLHDLARVCAEGIASGERVVDLALRRRAQRTARGGGEAQTVDRKVDKLIKALFRRLEDVADSFADTPRGERAAELMAAYFPDGYYAITSLPYEDELAAVSQVFLAFTQGDAAGDVAPLELTSLIEGIGDLLPTYQAALELRALVTAGDVRAARDEMHAATCAAVAFVLFTYRRPQDEPRRAKLLAAFDDQYARAAASRRRGGTGTVAEGEDGAGLDLEAEDIDAEVLDEQLLLDEAVAGEGGPAPGEG